MSLKTAVFWTSFSYSFNLNSWIACLIFCQDTSFYDRLNSEKPQWRGAKMKPRFCKTSNNFFGLLMWKYSSNFPFYLKTVSTHAKSGDYDDPKIETEKFHFWLRDEKFEIRSRKIFKWIFQHVSCLRIGYCHANRRQDQNRAHIYTYHSKQNFTLDSNSEFQFFPHAFWRKSIQKFCVGESMMSIK